MFWLLCTIVCLAIFLMAMTVGTVMASLVARLIGNRKVQTGTLHFPGLLFALRLFPVVAGVAVALGFALPSFLLLEPKQTIERPEPGLLLLSFCAAAVIAAFIGRAVRLLLTTRRIVGEWCRAAEPLHVTGLSVPTFVIDKPESLIAVAGFFRPKIFIGKRAFASLGSAELGAALAHESAHMRSFDNLKQLLLHVTRFPKYFRHLGVVEASWVSASECAADRRALEDGISPLDLASTLVKIGRLKGTASAMLAVSHLVPASCSSAVAMRVHWLQGVLAESSPKAARPRRIAYPLIGLLMACAYLVMLPVALPVSHRFIEWLVR
jgi:hypothetical protein